MPNHITNRLVIDGTDNEIFKVMSFLKGNDTDIDFEKIVPCPQIIKDVGEIHGGIKDAVKNKYNVGYSDNPLLASLEMSNRRKKIKLDDKDIPLFEKACLAYKYTGYIYWYDWNIEHWGTKWNAYESSFDDGNVLIWKTAWSDVSQLMILLSNKFKNVKFIYSWADEDTGCNVGRITLENGTVTEEFVPEDGSKEAFELCFELNPNSMSSYTLVDDKYEYNEEEE